MTLDQLLDNLSDLVHHRFADNVAPSTIKRMLLDELGDREPMTLAATRLLRAVVEFELQSTPCPDGKPGCLVAHYVRVCKCCRHAVCTCELGELRKLLEGENAKP